MPFWRASVANVEDAELETEEKRSDAGGAISALGLRRAEIPF